MIERDDWRVRPLLTAAIGLVAALIVQQLTVRNYALIPVVYPSTARIALAMAVGVAGILAIFTIERLRPIWAIGFALACGTVAGLILWWSGPAQPNGNWFWDWRTACLFLAIAIAAPLFQTARDAGAARFDYREVHGHAWTNVVLWAAGCVFTGIAFALALLLSALFQLIGIRVLEQLLRHDWATAMLFGAAFGGAVGLLRERDGVVRTLQRVVTAILSVLAPVLAVGLVLFLASLPFTGLSALWDATRSTTPILLSCVIGALILANAVIGDEDAPIPTNPVLRWSAMALGAVMLPLAIVAANAAGLRIDQYGFTPDRLWGLTFVVVACAYGLAYLVALRRWRAGWAGAVRHANLRLAFALMGLAALLATPLVSFNAISTRDQVARLESGRVQPDEFDWGALGFDFGAPGRAAVERLSRSSSPQVAALARTTLAAKNRWDLYDAGPQARRRDTLDSRLRILPRAAIMPPTLRDAVSGSDACDRSDTDRCTLLWTPGEGEAFAVRDACIRELANAPNTPIVERLADRDCPVTRLRETAGVWARVEQPAAVRRDASTGAAIVAGLNSGQVEVRPVTRRQLFIGGKPVGEAFE